MASSEDYQVEIKKIRKENNCETAEKKFCDVDQLVHNPGLQHLALYIFKLLDFTTLTTCRAISKSWKAVIDNDKHWWKLLLFKCTGVCVYYTTEIESYNSWLLSPKFLKDLYPKFVDTFDYICDKETLDTVEMFTKFMIDYFKALNTKNLNSNLNVRRSPLHYASLLKREVIKYANYANNAIILM